MFRFLLVVLLALLALPLPLQARTVKHAVQHCVPDDPEGPQTWVQRNPVFNQWKAAFGERVRQGATIPVTIEGQVVEFTFFGTCLEDGKTAWNVALSHEGWKFTDMAAPADKEKLAALSDVHISDPILVYSQEGAEIRLGDIPEGLRKRFENIFLGLHAAGHDEPVDEDRVLEFRQGLNVYAPVDLGRSGDLGDFARNFGIGDKGGMISGGLGTKTFEALFDAEKRKTLAWDDLKNGIDLQLWISGMRPKGLEDTMVTDPILFEYRHATEDDSIAVHGETTAHFHVQSTHLDAKLTIDYDREPDEDDPKFLAEGWIENPEEREKAELESLFPRGERLDVERAGIRIAWVHRKHEGKSHMAREFALFGEAKLHPPDKDAKPKDVHFSIDYTPDDDGGLPTKHARIEAPNEDVSLADVVHEVSEIPGMDLIQVHSILLTRHWSRASIGFAGKGKKLTRKRSLGLAPAKAHAWIYSPSGSKKPNIVLTHEAVPFPEIMPWGSDTLFGDTVFESLGVVLVPRGNDSAAVHPSDLPGALVEELGGAESGIFPFRLQQGVNLLGTADVKNAGTLASWMRYLGVNARKLNFKGLLCKEALFGPFWLAWKASRHIPDDVMNELLAMIHVEIPLPSLSLFAHAPWASSGNLGFQDSVLVLAGKKKDELEDIEAGLDIYIQSTAVITSGDMNPVLVEGELRAEMSGNHLPHHFTFEGHHEGEWSDAFGIHDVVLRNVDVALGFDRKSQEIETSFTGVTTLGKSEYAATLSVVVEKGNWRSVEPTISLTAPIPAASIPGIREIPGADEITLEALEFSRHHLSADVSFRKNRGRVVGWAVGGKKSLGVMLQQAKLGKIIPGIEGTAFDDIPIPHATLVLTRDDWSAKYKDLPPAVQGLFVEAVPRSEEGHPYPGFEVEVGSGVTLVALLDPSQLKGELKDSAKVLGLEESIGLMGRVSGFFSGKPAFDLSGNLPMMRPPDFPGVEPVKDAGGTLSLGFGGGKGLYLKVTGKSHVKVDDPAPLFKGGAYFRSKLGAVFETGFSAEMEGRWDDVGGATGFDLENVGLELGVKSIGGAPMTHLGLSGEAHFGDEVTASVALDYTCPVGSPLTPTDFAYMGHMNVLGPREMILVGNALRLPDVKFSDAQVHHFLDSISWLTPLQLKDVGFATVSFGASLPEDLLAKKGLEINGYGMAFKGELEFGDLVLGEVKGYSSNDGVKLYGDVKPFQIGPLKMDKAVVDIALNVHEMPHLIIQNHMKLLGAAKDYDLIIDRHGFLLRDTMSIGDAFEFTFEARTKKGWIPGPGNDFVLHGVMEQDFEKYLHGQVQGAIKDGLKKLEDGSGPALEAVRKAKKVVESKRGYLEEVRAKVRKRKEKVNAAFNKAQAEVNRLNKKYEDIKDDIDDTKHDIKHTAWYRVDKLASLGTKLTGLYIAYGSVRGARETAYWVLEAAKKTADFTPIDADPNVVEAIVALDGARWALAVAEGAIVGYQATRKEIEGVLVKLADLAGAGLNIFDVKRAEVSGSLAAALHNDVALTLTMDVAIMKRDFTITEEFRPSDSKVLLDKLAELGRNIGKGIVELVKDDHPATRYAKAVPPTVPAYTWQHYPGKAVDIAAGPDGTMAVVGTNQKVFVFDTAMQRWLDTGKGGAVRVAMDEESRPWVLLSNGRVSRFVCGNWIDLPPLAGVTDIGIGAEGSVWVARGAGYPVSEYDRAAGKWVERDGHLLRIAVDPGGTPWGVMQTKSRKLRNIDGYLTGLRRELKELQENTKKNPFMKSFAKQQIRSKEQEIERNERLRKQYSGESWSAIWHRHGGKWTTLDSGRGCDIAVGGDGSVWVIGSDESSVWGLDSRNLKWIKISGGLSSLAALPDGRPIGVNRDTQIWVTSRRKGAEVWGTEKWEARVPALDPTAVRKAEEALTAGKCGPALTWVGVGGGAIDAAMGGGTTAVVGTNLKNNNVFRWHRDRSKWIQLKGWTARRTAVGKDGTIWVVGLDGTVARYLCGRFERTEFKAHDVGAGEDGSVFAIGKAHGKVHRWVEDAYAFHPFGGTGKRIAVDGGGNPWVVTGKGGLKQWTGSAWKAWPSQDLTDVGVTAGGLVLVTNEANAIWGHFPGTPKFLRYPGTAKSVAGGPHGGAILTRPDNKIQSALRLRAVPQDSHPLRAPPPASEKQFASAFESRGYTDGCKRPWSWKTHKGQIRDIGVGPKGGQTWVVGMSGTVYWVNRANDQWSVHKNRIANRIAVGPDGTPWYGGRDSKLYRWVCSGWRGAGGDAMDVGVGADGSVFRLDTNGVLFEWNPLTETWAHQKGVKGKRLSVDPAGNPWVIDQQDRLKRFENGKWLDAYPLPVRDVAIGNGGETWVVRPDHTIWGRNGTTGKWFRVPGRALEVTVNEKGLPIVVGTNNGFYEAQALGKEPPTAWKAPVRKRDPAFVKALAWQRKLEPYAKCAADYGYEKLDGHGRDMAVGAEGTVYIVGNTEASENVYRWEESDESWRIHRGVIARRITVDREGNPWVVTPQGKVHRWRCGKWESLPGILKDIEAGADGTVVGSDAGGVVVIWDEAGRTWKSTGGTHAPRVSVDPGGNPWQLKPAGNIWRMEKSRWVQVGGGARDLAIGPDGSVFVLGSGNDSGVYAWTRKGDGSYGWKRVRGAAEDIGVDPTGSPWVANKSRVLYRGVKGRYYGGVTKKDWPKRAGGMRVPLSGCKK